MAAFDFNQLLSQLGNWRGQRGGPMPQMPGMQGQGSFGGGKGPSGMQLPAGFGGGKGPTGMQMPAMSQAPLLGPGNPLNTPMRFTPPVAVSPLAPTAAQQKLALRMFKSRANNPGDYGR
jgi:hypothetical protein